MARPVSVFVVLVLPLQRGGSEGWAATRGCGVSPCASVGVEVLLPPLCVSGGVVRLLVRRWSVYPTLCRRDARCCLRCERCGRALAVASALNLPGVLQHGQEGGGVVADPLAGLRGLPSWCRRFTADSPLSSLCACPLVAALGALACSPRMATSSIVPAVPFSSPFDPPLVPLCSHLSPQFWAPLLCRPTFAAPVASHRFPHLWAPRPLLWRRRPLAVSCLIHRFCQGRGARTTGG